jgi:hypothetical protein
LVLGLITYYLLPITFFFRVSSCYARGYISYGFRARTSRRPCKSQLCTKITDKNNRLERKRPACNERECANKRLIKLHLHRFQRRLQAGRLRSSRYFFAQSLLFCPVVAFLLRLIIFVQSHKSLKRISEALASTPFAFSRTSDALERTSLALERTPDAFLRMSFALERTATALERSARALEHNRKPLERARNAFPCTRNALEHNRRALERFRDAFVCSRNALSRTRNAFSCSRNAFSRIRNARTCAREPKSCKMNVSSRGIF